MIIVYYGTLWEKRKVILIIKKLMKLKWPNLQLKGNGFLKTKTDT